ncbi:SPOR domain-containing protein [Rickettsiales endosymbiont of Stachyamoeba lipophora]|uniref:SPOR domain-containing protein n=1 Tax=Rickettsiales endosymbiont of Stachyamoeba lipophora TaxID=2486578 RepID=UPI000F647B4B|nr:SPOR domain-containing protein [Rickettsiales endosymbiont of Stachyamoeba lipophora]AZL15357.1 SPOR domain-containing protein [Rickettsiales endosymbiont of Stachyamoeba lipophora]
MQRPTYGRNVANYMSMENRKEPKINQGSEDFDEDYFVEKSSGYKNLTTLLLVIFALTGFAVLGWYGYKINSSINSAEELNIIKYENKATKTLPDDPGGMVINDMDKSVYDNLTNTSENLPKIEKISPSTEEPIEHKRATFEEPIKLEIETESQANSDDFHAEQIAAKEPLKSETIDIYSQIENKPKKKEAKLRIVEQPVDIKTATAKRKEIKDRIANANKQPKGYYIQIASLKTKEDAEKTWLNISNKYKSILGNMDHYIVTKEIPTKGLFYRLQAGPISSSTDARLLCSKLIKLNQPCITAKR